MRYFVKSTPVIERFMPNRLGAIGLIASFILGLLGGPFPAEAQEAEKVYRIGLLHSRSPSRAASFANAFRQSMRERGYAEGKNYVLEIRAADGKRDRLPDLTAELVGLKPDIILTSGFHPVRAAKKATRVIPIVMRTSADPVRFKIVDSLARPGGNITGVFSTNDELIAKRMELLEQIVPGLERVGVLNARPNFKDRKGYKELITVARARGVELQMTMARDADAIESAFAQWKKGRADAVMMIPAPPYLGLANHILNGAATNKLPLICTTSTWAREGCLMSYGGNPIALIPRLASFVDKILKGVHPADLPVERAVAHKLVINLKTAKALGITIPTPVLYRADKVIK